MKRETLWWTCPNCGAKVDFKELLTGENGCFDRTTGEATARCLGAVVVNFIVYCPNCKANWEFNLTDFPL